VFRFDFTGLGESGGDFVHTNFSSNLEDLVVAADHMREQYQAPHIVIGQSLGGSTALAVDKLIPEVNAAATIGAERYLAPRRFSFSQSPGTAGPGQN
jgi:alpha/beta superfamily hydrolase